MGTAREGSHKTPESGGALQGILDQHTMRDFTVLCLHPRMSTNQCAIQKTLVAVHLELSCHGSMLPSANAYCVLCRDTRVAEGPCRNFEVRGSRLKLLGHGESLHLITVPEKLSVPIILKLSVHGATGLELSEKSVVQCLQPARQPRPGWVPGSTNADFG